MQSGRSVKSSRELDEPIDAEQGCCFLFMTRSILSWWSIVFVVQGFLRDVSAADDEQSRSVVLPHEEMAAADRRADASGRKPETPAPTVEDKSGWDWLPTLDWNFRFQKDRPNFSINSTIYAWHFDPETGPFEEPLNDWPLGIGFNYELVRDPDWIWAVNADIVFFDSNDDFAGDIGTSVQWHNPVVDVGMQFMILYKRNFENEWGVPIGPALFPYLQREFEFFAVRMYWIPPVRKASDNQVFFQIQVPIGTTNGI